MTDKERKNIEKAVELLQARLDGARIEFHEHGDDEWLPAKFCLKKGIVHFSFDDDNYRAVYPKLDHTVFDREDCPEWANYAAVDEDGSVAVGKNEPELCGKMWGGFAEFRMIKSKFDARDWKNSIIKRNRLPKWCEVGKTVFTPDGMVGDISSIAEQRVWVNIDGEEQQSWIYSYLTPAIFEPLTEEELAIKVPFSVMHKCSSLVYEIKAYLGNGNFILDNGYWEYVIEMINFDNYKFPDGSPIGKYRTSTKEEMEEMK